MSMNRDTVQLSFNVSREDFEEMKAIKNSVKYTWIGAVKEGIRVLESLNKDIANADAIGSCVPVYWHTRIQRIRMKLPRGTFRKKTLERRYVYWIMPEGDKFYNIWYKREKDEKMNTARLKNKNVSKEALRMFGIGMEEYML